MLMRAGCDSSLAVLKGERRNSTVVLVYWFVLPCVWLGPMQIWSGFGVRCAWVWFVRFVALYK